MNVFTRAAPTSVAVVIPVYKNQLTEYERISLTQCMRLLGNYPVWLVGPHTLDRSAYDAIDSRLQLRTFDDGYFSNIQAYNRLMLSEEFYQAFTPWKYILIHQLDAFVFRDDLAYWCAQQYDYIGAPWLRDRDFFGWKDQLDFLIRQRIAIWMDLKKEDGVTPREIINLNGVGNGGLSLRRVSAMLRGVQKFRDTIAAYQTQSMYQYNEDVFFSTELNRYWPRIRIPSYRKALHFSIEFFPEWAVTHYNKGQLPFGCHAWDIHGTDFWRPVFAQYGYTI